MTGRFQVPASCFYQSQRLRLHYVDWGNESAPPLILLHGNRDHCRSWDWVAERLRDQYHIIAPDLRGHGDSSWSPEGNYTFPSYVYDLAELIRQRNLAPVRIIAHSLAGVVSLRYAGVFPESVLRVVAIEGLGIQPKAEGEQASLGTVLRLRRWIERRHELTTRRPRRYTSIDDAMTRMWQENARLSREQVHHLTFHGMALTEDGSYTWKYDNYSRLFSLIDISLGELKEIWARIICPTLLVWGSESWAPHPRDDGKLAAFTNATVAEFKAGHWVHHDQLEEFVAQVGAFLAD